ncbi:hypothetical protein Taro_056638 [Colocasia esculenta]|uniref:Uncharacterized protein n=1 Tax=Colocasia esculenta TaxID=4460 RepID=A0A843XX17_COLES|nr:hypothetical protein [Colocasia esculenta]
MEKVESSTFFFQELLDRQIFRALCSSLKQGSSNSCLGHLSTGDSKTEVWIFSSVRSVDSRRPSVNRYALLCKRQKFGYLDCEICRQSTSHLSTDEDFLSNIEEDGTLTSMVKGTQIRITRELLASLFEVSTSGCSGVHTVDTHIKAVAESAAAKVLQAAPAAPAVEEPVVAAAPAPEAAVVDESSRRIEDIPPEDIEPIGQFSEVPLPSSQVGSLLRDALDSISQGEPVAHEPSIAKSVAEVHTGDVVMEEAPSQQEQVQVQEDVVMEDAPIEGEQSVTEEFQGVSAVASGHTEIHSEVLSVQEEEAAAAAQTKVPMESVHAEGEAEVEKGSETQGEGNENPPENQFREDSEDDQD